MSELIKVASSWGIVTSMFLLDPIVSTRHFRIGRLELFPFQFSMHPISGPGSFWLFVSGMVTTQHYLVTITPMKSDFHMVIFSSPSNR